ncbi:M56 family metallopeptidase [Mucilaginibacter flavus]|uniref:M56 family metallopeptidase n=1 Tax=Mucilaginibacter flavus TaxID=931504 RepID=UPI0025B314D7|nr:M56 family metallopeptidase [Mucilaginibacter flavus]MDN3581551.1 M56 family metallopeptidase [Mucilaginibacter flavus]
MISYLLKFVACSGLLLFIYHLLLKNKAMYHFNRGYLLAAVMFALAVPFITIEQRPSLFMPAAVTMQQQVMVIQDVVMPKTDMRPDIPITNAPTINWGFILFITYTLITGLLLVRFLKNLYNIWQAIVKNINVNYGRQSLVLVPDKVMPHTFFNYIFLNDADYRGGEIAVIILKHELAHARQSHSADVLFMELIQVFCWFNPFIIFYRRAIQLNHEFLADEAVLNNNADIRAYQYLLLNSLGDNAGLGITSQFNYSLTKKRLIMMTKKTSALTAVLSSLAIFTMMGAAFVLFCNMVSSDKQPKPRVGKLSNIVIYKGGDTLQPVKWPQLIVPDYPKYPHSKEGVAQTAVDEYTALVNKYLKDLNAHKPSQIKVTPTDRARMIDIFKHMSIAQQQQQRIGFMLPSPPLPMSKVTQAELNAFKDPKKFGVWLNDKHINNADLANYKPADFMQLFVSRLTPHAINYKYYHYQVDLMTTDHYATYLKQTLAERNESRMFTRSVPAVF